MKITASPSSALTFYLLISIFFFPEEYFDIYIKKIEKNERQLLIRLQF